MKHPYSDPELMALALAVSATISIAILLLIPKVAGA